jgi:3D-(3,5/4)-trihydroxycyclohexane-1,2-dione acylhydrolase (decyclizing)
VDYAKVASGYGLKTYTARTIGELKSAIADARRQSVSTLIDLKVIPKTMTDGYKTWWNVGVATTSEKPEVREAAKQVLEMREKARKY